METVDAACKALLLTVINPEGLYTSYVSFPKTEKSEMILFNLILSRHLRYKRQCPYPAVQTRGSHVIRAINNNPNQVTVRFSFSKQ